MVSVQEHVNGHSANEDDPKCAFAFSCVLTTSPGGAYPKSAVLWLKRSRSKSKIIEHIFSGNRGCFFLDEQNGSPFDSKRNRFKQRGVVRLVAFAVSMLV